MPRNPRFRKCVFTWNNYGEDSLTHLTHSFEVLGVTGYVIGKEIGEEGTPHLQGYVEFGRQVYWNTIKDIHPSIHWERAKGTRKQNVKYCTKDGDFTSTFPPDPEEAAANLRAELLSYYDDTVWHDWQQDVLDLVEEEPDNRTVHWLWESEGNVGKSYLAKYLFLKYDAIIATGKANDIYNQVLTWMTNHPGQSPRLILVDTPRVSIEYISYQAMENLKNGLLYSGKYEGGTCAFHAPHVVVFANMEPNWEMMSSDRWVVKEIKKD